MRYSKSPFLRIFGVCCVFFFHSSAFAKQGPLYTSIQVSKVIRENRECIFFKFVYQYNSFNLLS